MSKHPQRRTGSAAPRDEAVERTHATRRRLLSAATAGGVAALAGCAQLTADDAPEDLTFEKLQATAVYVDADVDLTMPEEVETVDAKTNADLLVLAGDTDVEAEVAADWLAADRTVALLGDGAEATWLDWARSDEFDDTFDTDGVADSDPDPQLLVGTAFDTRLSTYRNSWADGPRDRDVLRALDERLVDIEQQTASETAN